MPFWPFRKRERLNTLNLHGDLDDVELVQDVEKTFGISIANEEAKKIATVGDLDSLVRKHMNPNACDPLWELLCRIARDHSGQKGPIDRETTFFASIAKERMKNG